MIIVLQIISIKNLSASNYVTARKWNPDKKNKRSRRRSSPFSVFIVQQSASKPARCCFGPVSSVALHCITCKIICKCNRFVCFPPLNWVKQSALPQRTKIKLKEMSFATSQCRRTENRIDGGAVLKTENDSSSPAGTGTH